MHLIHSDLCGPLPITSVGGSKYFMLFIDDYSRMTWIYFLQKKLEAFETFKIFHVMIENQAQCKIGTL